MTPEPMPVCGERGCKVEHPSRPWSDRPLGRRLAALHPEPEPRKGPAWLERLTAKELVR